MPDLVQSGLVYRITNVKAGTVVDLSGMDNKSSAYNSPPLLWMLTWTGHGWTFRSLSAGLYLGLAGNPADGTPIIATSSPFEFDIWHDEQNEANYRIFVPNTSQNFDLYNDGNPTPGTPITLWAKWAGIHQTWKFERGKCFRLVNVASPFIFF
ncbi:ricin B-like lectin [Mycena filopes]|nr:ricin B-like lectin [Mycena filopes]